MNPQISILVSGVTKKYPVFDSPWQAFRYLLLLIWRAKSNDQFAACEVTALSNISFAIKSGERVGIVGRNGAGKSTLLKLLAGNFPPTTGNYFVNGNVYCLLPGTVSFSLEKSTGDNARYYLGLFGLPPERVEERIRDIMDFTELGEYFDQPVHKLSLGMRVRAEFAVATAQSSEIMIIDEVLGAGDIYWTEKIARRMESLCAKGVTLLLVSHSMSQVNRYCDRAVWIEGGRVLMDGPALEVTKRYEGFLERLSWQTEDIDDKTESLDGAAEEMGQEVLSDSGQTVIRWPGKGGARITGVWLNGRAVHKLELTHNDPLEVRLVLRTRVAGEYNLRYLLTFWDANGKRFGVIECESDRFVVGTTTQEACHEVTFTRATSGLGVGNYYVTVAVIDALAALNTTNEHNSRVDVIYKSFEILVNCQNVGDAEPRPLFYLDLTSKATPNV